MDIQGQLKAIPIVLALKQSQGLFQVSEVLLIKFVVVEKGVSQQVDEVGGDGEAIGDIQGHFF